MWYATHQAPHAAHGASPRPWPPFRRQPRVKSPLETWGKRAKIGVYRRKGQMISQDFGSFNIFFGFSDSTKMFQHIFFWIF